MEFSMTEHGFETTTEYGTLTVSSNDEHGFRPYQLLVSSIAVCSGGVLRNVFDKMRMPLTDLSIVVKDVVRNVDEANKVEKIHLHFIIEGEKVEEKKVPRALELAKKNCAMAQSVSGSIEVVETYEIRKQMK